MVQPELYHQHMQGCSQGYLPQYNQYHSVHFVQHLQLILEGTVTFYHVNRYGDKTLPGHVPLPTEKLAELISCHLTNAV